MITPTVTELTGPALGESGDSSHFLATITAKLARRCVQSGRSSAAPRKAARHAPVTERIKMKRLSSGTHLKQSRGTAKPPILSPPRVRSASAWLRRRSTGSTSLSQADS